MVTHKTQHLWDVLGQRVDDGVGSGIKRVCCFETTLGHIVGCDELNDGVGGVGEVGDGRVAVQTDCMKLVAVLWRHNEEHSHKYSTLCV